MALTPCSEKRRAPATPPNPSPKLPRTNFSSDTAKQINFQPSTAKQTQFPADFIEDILVRLGVKSLLRFKCLSKQWFFLLSHTKFITRHLKTMKTRQNFIIWTEIPEDKFGIVTLYNNGDGIVFQPLEFPVQPLETFWGFHGDCNGLLCLSFYSEETDRSSLFVWNPSTKEQKKFPSPQCRRKRTEGMAFGYDSVRDDYKVVLLTFAMDKLVNIQSFSLNMGSWKTVENRIPYRFRVYGPLSNGRHVNGCIYWTIRKLDNGVFVNRIASLDVFTDSIREEESLSGVLSNECSYDSLVLCGECLCLVRCHEHARFEVWRMKEDEVRKTKVWIKLYTLDKFTTPINPGRKDIIFPIYFTGNGKVLLFSPDKYEYALYDLNDGSVQEVAESGIHILHSIPLGPCVESLVSLSFNVINYF